MTHPHPHTCEDCDETFGCVDQYRCVEVCGPCQEARWLDDDEPVYVALEAETQFSAVDPRGEHTGRYRLVDADGTRTEWMTETEAVEAMRPTPTNARSTR